MTFSPYWLYVAGINFSSTLYDTQDLSCIRGSSYGLLSMPTKLAAQFDVFGVNDYEKIFSGASEGLFKILGGPEEEQLKKAIEAWLSEQPGPGKEPYRFLSFGLSILPCDDKRPFHEIFAILKSKIRLNQLRNLNVNLAGGEGFSADQYCEIDRLRPATKKEGGAKRRKISDSVYYRQQFGRDVKQSFYKRQFDEERDLYSEEQEELILQQQHNNNAAIGKLKEAIARNEKKMEFASKSKGRKINKTLNKDKKKLEEILSGERQDREKECALPSSQPETPEDDDKIKSFLENSKARFSSSFSDIVDAPPNGVADNLQGKMAVLYMDGNQFTKKMGIIGAETPDIFKDNSRQLKLYQVRLLQRLVHHFLKTDGLTFVNEKGEQIMRLETLFWGGDEMLLVMPSWAALEVCRIMFDEFKGWTLLDDKGGKQKLTYAAGLVIAHHKTPIIQLKNLANKIADDAKDLDKSKDDERANLNILQYEILESDDIPDANSFNSYRHRKYQDAFVGKKDFADLSFAIMGDHMSQIIDVIYCFKTRVARSRLYNLIHEAQNPDIRHEKGLNDYIKEELAHYGGNVWKMLIDSGLGRAKTTGLVGEKDGLMALIHVVQLWDYVDPQGIRAEEDEATNNNKRGDQL